MCAGTIAPTTSRQIFYRAAHRALRLPDGSLLLIYEPDQPSGRAPGQRVYIVSPEGPDGDRSFSLETLIPNRVAAGSLGQIRSAAVSPDGQWLAAVGGWLGADDNRGHNGIFLLHLDEPSGGFWHLKTWFEVPDLAVGDIAFGPDDLLLATSQPHRPGSGAAPVVTLFSYAGQRLGSFIDSPNHGVLSSAPLDMRIARTGEHSYLLYDPEVGQLRSLAIVSDKPKPRVIQTGSVPLPFAPQRAALVVFDPRPDGRVVLGRSVVENGRGRTLLSVIGRRGEIVEEWESPRWWQYGFADDRHVVHGFSPGRAEAGMEIREVVIR